MQHGKSCALLLFTAIIFVVFQWQVPGKKYTTIPDGNTSNTSVCSNDLFMHAKGYHTHHVPWEQYDETESRVTAGFFTPYHITMGGGERYFLSAVRAAQILGYYVDILVTINNVCQHTKDVIEVGNMLRIDLDASKLAVTVVHVTESNIVSNKRYDLFFLLGNEKYPLWHGLGKVNMYMCQFPFDLNRVVDLEHVRAFSSYDYVFLNSKYSLSWYVRLISPVISDAEVETGIFPSIEVLYPPVIPFNMTNSHRVNIVLLGRFFSGRQSKGHSSAIEVFSKIRNKLPHDCKLILVGNMWPGHEEYVHQLKVRAAGLPIEFVIGKDSKTVEDVLQTSLIQWHMTGMEVDPNSDPASIEHFGISIVEGQSAGCIPIAYCEGGARDIIEQGENGFLACSLQEFAQHTVKVFTYLPEEITRIQTAAIKSTERYSFNTFIKRFATYAHRGFLTKPFRFYIQNTFQYVRNLYVTAAPSSRYKAVIIEARPHYALEYVVKTTMWHLGNDWSLHIFHTRLNRKFVHRVFSNITNVHYTELSTDVIDIPQYNHLLKSVEFWESMKAEKILIFQTDSLVIRPGVEQYLMYDYVGAPWHLENERWSKMRDILPDGVGNGGFSIRDVNASIRICKLYGNASPDHEQEDLFFVLKMRELGYTIANRSSSYTFCLEVPCHDVKTHSSHFAVHAAWYYNPYSKLKEMFMYNHKFLI